MIKRKKFGFATLLVFIILALSVQAVAADDSVPVNPGVTETQEEVRAQSLQWILVYEDVYKITVGDYQVFLDWGNVDIYSTEAPVEGVLAINTLCGAGGGIGACLPVAENIVDPSLMTPEELGLPLDTGAIGYINDCSLAGNNCIKIDSGVEDGGTFYPTNSPTVVILKAGTSEFYFVKNMAACDPIAMPYCVTWNEDGSITVVRNGSGPTRKEISNIQFWLTGYSSEPMPEIDNLCPTVLVEPGALTVSSAQIAPEFAVVTGQDLESTGVTIEWFFQLDPTIVTYETWGVLGREFLACVEGPSQNPDQDPCQAGWHAVYLEIRGCEPHTITYREEVSDLSALATLSLDSRVWITDELASVYRGAHLIHPDWGLEAPEACNWAGDSCVISFTARFEMKDPGTYDVKMVGVTSGTEATPPRSFDEVSGYVDVYLLDSSITGSLIPVTN